MCCKDHSKYAPESIIQMHNHPNISCWYTERPLWHTSLHKSQNLWSSTDCDQLWPLDGLVSQVDLPHYLTAAISQHPMHARSFLPTQPVKLLSRRAAGGAGVPMNTTQQQQEAIMPEAVQLHLSSACIPPAASPVTSFGNHQGTIDIPSAHRSYPAAVSCFLHSGKAAAAPLLMNVTDPASPTDWLCPGQADAVQNHSLLSGAEAQESACPSQGAVPPCSALLVSMIFCINKLTWLLHLIQLARLMCFTSSPSKSRRYSITSKILSSTPTISNAGHPCAPEKTSFEVSQL